MTMHKNLIFLGPPGTGKGTIAQMLNKKYGIPQISTGDLFRENTKNNTPLGKKVKTFMESGKLVPDELTFEMLKERIAKKDCKNGFILDGFPRTLAQAELLEKHNVKIDHVLNFTASQKTILDRLSGRWTCKGCGAIFHEKNIPPKAHGKCDHCGGELYQRDDQKPDVVKVRLKEYNEKTHPLVAHYKKKKLLADIDTELPVEEILGEVEEAIS